jgi:hypothetical protein
LGISFDTRATPKLFPGATRDTAFVCMSMSPTFHPRTFPEMRAPATIGICSPVLAMPMRREKKRSTSPLFPAVKRPAFSRKKGRFSGKNNEKRSRFTCWSSTSTCAKSVFTVASRVSEGVMEYFRSPPTSPPVSNSDCVR